NLEQLKKQAKHLRNAYPDIVATHGNRLTLAQAQSVIAHLNGFPSWELMVHKSAAPDAEAGASSASIVDLIQKGLIFFFDEELSDVPLAYSEHTGMPTRYREAHVAILRYVQAGDAALAAEEREALYELMDDVFGNTYEHDFRVLSRPVQKQFEAELRASLKQAPLNIEGHHLLCNLLYSQGRYEEADQLSKPVLDALLSLLPTDREVQIDYGFLQNRPIFRLLNCRILVLDKLNRHSEAEDRKSVV